jgi:hypothetical protein
VCCLCGKYGHKKPDLKENQNRPNKKHTKATLPEIPRGTMGH